MTAPDLSYLIPSKWKAVVALVGSALSFLVPYILEVTNGLPAPWPAVVGVVLFILTAFGAYKAPYKPPGTVLAPAEAIPPGTPTDKGVAPVVPEPGKYRNPWR